MKKINEISDKNNSHSNDEVVCEKLHISKFINNIENMRNPHISDCVCLSEKYGTIEDYSIYQEQFRLRKI